jgi:ribosomal protein S12 methylthiotransferase accessory factor
MKPSDGRKTPSPVLDAGDGVRVGLKSHLRPTVLSEDATYLVSRRSTRTPRPRPTGT